VFKHWKKIAQGAIVPPNPPPPPIQPLGTHFLQKPNNFAPAAQQTQAKLSKRAPVPPPPTTFTAPPPQQQQQQPQWGMPPQQQQQQQWAMPQQAPNAPPPPPAGQPPKGMRKYGSSWMAGIVDNLDGGNTNTPPPPTLGGDMFAPAVDKNLARTNSQNVLNDYIATQGGEVGSKGLARQETSNLALLDKLLSDGGLAAGALGGEVGAPDFTSPNGEKSKGLKNYSSWGSIGGGDFGANLFGTDTTAGNSGAPTVMRTGSSKQMKKMSSSNWGGATKGLGTYDSATDIKNILNML